MPRQSLGSELLMPDRVDRFFGVKNPDGSEQSFVEATVSQQSYISFLNLIGEELMDIISTFSALPSAAQNFRRAFYTTDTQAAYISDGANWLPLTDRILFDLGATTPPVSATGVTETAILGLQAVIPAGMWRPGQELVIRWAGQKSGTAENGTARIRCGTAGTTADAAISGSAGSNFAVGTSDAAGYEARFKRLTATTILKIGPGPTALASYPGASGSDIIAATTVPNLDSNAVFITPTMQMSSTVESITHSAYRIELTR